jgi:hypothetical protein
MTRIAVTIPVDPPTAFQVQAGAHRQLAVFKRPQVTLTCKGSDDLITPAKKGTGYRFYRAVGAGAFALLAANNVCRWTDSRVTRRTKYTYYAVAFIGNVMSKPSSTASATP